MEITNERLYVYDNSSQGVNDYTIAKRISRRKGEKIASQKS